MPRPPLRLVLTAAALAPVSLVLSHELSLVAAYGQVSQAVLRATGHDARWTSAVQAVIVIFAALAVLGLVRLAVLWRTARRLERTHGTRVRADWRALGRTALVIWAWLAVVTVVWFFQENIERLSVGQPLAGLAPLLESGLVGPLLIIPAVSLVVALVGGLFRWGAAVLRARIAAAIAAQRHRVPSPVRVPGDADHRHASALSRNLGLRAPPVPASA